MKTPIELYVIDRVRDMRNKAGISQAELALKLGLSVGFIGHIENPNQRAKYNLNHINQLANIFNCEFADFFPSKPFDELDE